MANCLKLKQRAGARPDPRLQQWQEEVEARQQRAAELPEEDEVPLLPLGAEWKFATEPDPGGQLGQQGPAQGTGGGISGGHREC